FAATATLSVASLPRAEVGAWNPYVTGNLSCSCLPGTPVGYGGSGAGLSAFIDNYQLTTVYAHYAVYHRCSSGACYSQNVVHANGVYAPFIQLGVLSAGSLCFSVGIESAATSCAEPIKDH